jgi:hypothetical protein
VIEALHTTTLRGVRDNKLRVMFDFIAALFYNVTHSMLKFVQLVTLNVAMNSKSNAVLTLVISSNFAEMKSLVFKRFDESNVFQISCADIVERFMLAIFLTLVFVQNWAQSSLTIFEYVFFFFYVCVYSLLFSLLNHTHTHTHIDTFWMSRFNINSL